MKHLIIFPNRCKVVFAEGKSKVNLPIYVSNYIRFIQKLEKLFMSENLFSVAEPEKKKPHKTSSINSRGTERFGSREKTKTYDLFKEREK